jgi:hypothetical protein
MPKFNTASTFFTGLVALTVSVIASAAWAQSLDRPFAQGGGPGQQQLIEGRVIDSKPIETDDGIAIRIMTPQGIALLINLGKAEDLTELKLRAGGNVFVVGQQTGMHQGMPVIHASQVAPVFVLKRQIGQREAGQPQVGVPGQTGTRAYRPLQPVQRPLQPQQPIRRVP